MLTRDDLIDLVIRHLSGLGRGAEGGKSPPDFHKGKMAAPEELRGRLFLSEYEIKKRLTPQAQHLTIPKEAIISPLALDWLVLKGIKIVRE